MIANYVDGILRPFLSFLLALFLVSCASERKAMPMAVDGIIDLSEWDFEKDGPVDLKGEWRFVWEEFVEPLAGEVLLEKYQEKVEMPITWNRLSHPKNPGEMLSGVGFATLFLIVELDPVKGNIEMGLATATLHSAARYSVYSYDSKTLLGEMLIGSPGKSPESSIDNFRKAWEPFATGTESKIVILAHQSNFTHRKGGNYAAPQLGQANGLLNGYILSVAHHALMFGILFIIAIYHFMAFYQRRDELSLLYFGLICSACALRQWCVSRLSYDVGFAYSTEHTQLLLKLEYACMPLCIMTGGLFIYSLFPMHRFRIFVNRFCIGLGFFLLALVVFLDTVTITSYSNYFFFHLLVGIFISALFLIYNVSIGSPFARWVSLGVLLTLVGGINDVLVSKNIIAGIYISGYCFIGFILNQSGILSEKAARSHRQAKYLSENLKEEVVRQTDNLKLKTLEAQEATLEAVMAQEESEQLRVAAVAQTEQLKDLDKQKQLSFKICPTSCERR